VVPSPTPATINLTKIYTPINYFSIKKNKKVKFKYVLIYSNGTIKQKVKNLKYKKTGKKTFTIKVSNKRLKVVLRVKKTITKPIKVKVIKVKSIGKYFVKIKAKNDAYYKFPKYNGKSKLNKYGIYKVKKQTVKVKWWGRSFKKKV
jgi:hypothetical protein